jgi:hypothetical protein
VDLTDWLLLPWIMVWISHAGKHLCKLGFYFICAPPPGVLFTPSFLLFLDIPLSNMPPLNGASFAGLNLPFWDDPLSLYWKYISYPKECKSEYSRETYIPMFITAYSQ